MFFLKEVILCMAICIFVKATPLEASDRDERSEDSQNSYPSATFPHTNNDPREIAPARAKGREAPRLIGRTEYEDQVIVTSIALGLGGIGLMNACKTLPKEVLAVGFGASYLLADLSSGILHMTLDNIDANSCPTFLKKLATDFQNHHQEPWKMKIDSFWFQNSELYAGLICGFASALGLQAFGYDLSTYLIISTGLWSTVTQVAHAAAHGKFSNNKVISFLQNHGIILSKEHHRGHHQEDFSKNFCILAGYMEPVASRIYSGAKFAIGSWKKLWKAHSK